jgi:hypothetical protein
MHELFLRRYPDDEARAFPQLNVVAIRQTLGSLDGFLIVVSDDQTYGVSGHTGRMAVISKLKGSVSRPTGNAGCGFGCGREFGRLTDRLWSLEELVGRTSK